MASGTVATSQPAPRQETEKWYQSRSFKRFRRNPLALVGALIILGYVLIALFAAQLTYNRMDRNCIRDLDLRGEAMTQLLNPLEPVFWRSVIAPPNSCFTIPRASYSPIPVAPSAEYPLGITGGGYDILYGVIWGARSAFYIGVLVTGFSLLVGILVGGSAGFLGGRADNLLMRFTDTVLAFPSLILAIVFATLFGAGLFNVLFALALVGWPTYARLLRGDILKIKEQEYVAGARALGASSIRLFLRHVLPNSLASLIIVASLDIGAVVLTASTLAFLGLGADIGYADWGQMVSFARQWIQGPPGEPFGYWFTAFWPGVAIVFFVLGWNLLGDAFRDVSDVRGS